MSPSTSPRRTPSTPNGRATTPSPNGEPGAPAVPPPDHSPATPPPANGASGRKKRRAEPSANGANGAPAPAEPPANAANGEHDPGRDARGRFTKGNPGGPGNPFARQTAALRQALIEAVTEADMKAITAQLVLQAKYGDLKAAKLLFEYVIGKPTPPADPDTIDRHEWQTLLRQVT